MGKKNKIVGCKNYANKPLANPFIELIIEFQQDLQQKENNKKTLGKKKKISFVYASLEYSRRIKKNKK